MSREGRGKRGNRMVFARHSNYALPVRTFSPWNNLYSPVVYTDRSSFVGTLLMAQVTVIGLGVLYCLL